MKISTISNVFNIKMKKLTFKGANISKPSQGDSFRPQGTKIYYDLQGSVIKPSRISYKNGEVYVDSEKLSSYKMYQYDHQNKQTREVTYLSGIISSDKRYKNGKLIQDSTYGYKTNERAIVAKYQDDGSFDYNIARNFRFDTKNTPAFILRKSKDETSYNVFAGLNQNEQTPLIFSVDTKGKLGTHSARLTKDNKGRYSYSVPTKESFGALQKGLIELKEIILSDDMKSDFGQYRKFNEELDKALAFIEEELSD